MSFHAVPQMQGLPNVSIGRTIFFLIVIEVICASLYVRLYAQNSWSAKYKGVGTFSSPRVSDLNGDGIGDIIFGAGREEFQACDSAVVAVDGLSGKMLWHVSAKDQVFGSPSLRDLTDDGIDDVIINGRSAEFMAINGKTGKIIW